jgi:isopentenyl-diphosphate delta-isomerase type 1
MTEEVFDIVNERDDVIGQNTRREVHRLGLRHRAVHVLAFNSRGQVFLQKRSMKKDRQPGLWDSSASGHVDSGEDYDACVVRELREEIGLQVKQCPQRLFKIEACAETDQEFVWVYRCKADGPFELNPDEIERGGWFRAEDVTRWMAARPQEFATALLVIWQRIIRESPGSPACWQAGDPGLQGPVI